MKVPRKILPSKILRYVCAGALVAAFSAALLQSPLDKAVASPTAGNVAPRYDVDPFWPKPLPNNWLVGQVAGIAVDQYDHIWIIQRPRSLTSDERGASPLDADGDIRVDQDGTPTGPVSECCFQAPSVMEFDARGNLIQAWGGPADPGFLGVGGRCDPAAGCEWPVNEHGIYVDHNDNVYIGGNGSNPGDHQVLKFSKDGTFLLQIGQAGISGGSNDTNGSANGTPLLGRPADMEVDPMTNELYIADGYQNHRVIVVDADTGLYKRHWGAYGQNPVDDAGSDAMGPNNWQMGPYPPATMAPPHFRNPVHAVRITKDRLVYVADRPNNRIQVFKPDGTFVQEKFIARETLGPGSTWDLDTSRDRRETFLFNADGSNQHIWTLDRATLDILATFGRNGRSAGQFHWVHNLALDSKGNLYTAEVDTGKRAQKFVLRGGSPIN